MLLAEQLVHQRCVHPGPLVLRTAPLKFPTPATDRDRTVSRRSEPSSRTALMGEQPNPAPFCLYTLRMISNHSEGTFGRLRYILGGDRPSQTARLTLSPTPVRGAG